MKKNIHPILSNVVINCNCGNSFLINMAVNFLSFNIDVCNECHPFYTGKRRIIDTTGRVESFNKKFSKFKSLIKN